MSVKNANVNNYPNFKLTTGCGGWAIRVGVLPLLQQIFGLFDEFLFSRSVVPLELRILEYAYALHAWLAHVLVGLE